MSIARLDQARRALDRVRVALVTAGVASALATVAGAYERHVDCGNVGSSYTALDGRIFEQDQLYSLITGWGYQGGTPFTSTVWSPHHVVGTVDPTISLTARRDPHSYRFDVPDGSYLVTFHLAEIEHHGAGLRRFRARANGSSLFEIDVWSEVEKDHALVRRTLVTVTGGALVLEFEPAPDPPLVAGLSVESWTDDGTPPSAPSAEAISGFGRNILTWPVLGSDTAGYRVYRGASPDGPFPLLAEIPYAVDHFYDDDAPSSTAYYIVRALDVLDRESGDSALLQATVKTEDDTELPVYALSLSPDSLAVLNANPFSDDYVRGDVVREGAFVPDVPIRYRGNSSRRFNKKGFKLNLDPGIVVAGRDRFNLVAAYPEPSMLTNVVGFRLFGATTVPVPEVASSQVWLNGVYRGVFAEMEQIGDRFLDRVGLDEESSLYRALNANLSLLGSPSEYETRYEKITNVLEGYDDLITFIETINTTPDEDFPEAIAGVLDVNEYLDYYATQILIANDDFTHRDYFLYRDRTTGVWRVFAWDLDSVMYDDDYHIATGTSGHPDYSGINVLMDRLMDVPIYRYVFGQKLLAAMNGIFEITSMIPIIDDAYDTIAVDGVADPYKQDHLNTLRFASRPSNLKNFVVGRNAYLASAVFDYIPEVPQLVSINEVMARNGGTIADEFGEFDDWIEIANGSAVPVNLGGLTLTDDLSDPLKWVFPDTTLAPGEFLLVWADDAPMQGPLHAPFRLSASGETVALFDRIENGNALIDSHTFGPLGADVSEGRFPDASGPFETMPLPTPNAPNVSGGTLPPVILETSRDPEFAGAGEEVSVSVSVSADTTIAAVELSYRLDDGGFTTISMADDGASQDGAPGDGVYGAPIPPAASGTDVTYYATAIDVTGGVDRAPSDAPLELFGYTVDYLLPPLRLNEFLASNASVNADEFGDFDDWIELVNPSETPVGTLGLALTDDLDLPGRWPLPDLSLPADGYELVWADNEPVEGDLHATFKLSANGERIALFDLSAAVPVLVDSVNFGPQTTDVSMGRDPDASGPWRPYSPPTPRASNASILDAPSQSAPVAPGGPRLVVASPVTPEFTVRVMNAPLEGTLRIRVYDVAGRRVRDVRVDDDRVRLAARDTNDRSLGPGVYFVRLETSFGQSLAVTRTVVLH